MSDAQQPEHGQGERIPVPTEVFGEIPSRLERHREIIMETPAIVLKIAKLVQLSLLDANNGYVPMEPETIAIILMDDCRLVDLLDIARGEITDGSSKDPLTNWYYTLLDGKPLP